MGSLVRNFLLSSALFFISSLVLGQTTKILWHENNPLEWVDFKARPDGKSKFHALTASTFGASTSSGKNNTVFIKITSYFIPERSWVKPGKQKTALLKHEQLHFDLCEVYARQLRQQMKEKDNWSAKKFSRDFQKMTKSLLKKYERAQNKYDRKTQHGLKKEVQAKWEQDVARQLKELSDHRTISFKVSVRN